ncbi:MAG: 7-carboxy-7-deazaguanine synthase QueE [Planctomycetaceae bacterium]|jgi:7-carboxy-7-deazaguanine synthase|nr:7-carboxy-7-deazaguanine synthase QueE [Planctomycetaceae bacterium]
MQVLEIYQSKQGEGIWTGQPSIFVRFFGCRLHCRFCDTVYARSADDDDCVGADLTPEEIAGRVLLLDLVHVVLTGGEPMLSPEIVELTRLLKEYDYQITIETSGTIFRPVACDLISISPKLQNTLPIDGDLETIRNHERECSNPEIVQQYVLRYNYQLKFVIDEKADLPEVEEYLTHLHGVVPSRILLMPQATDVETMHQKASWLESFCREKGYRYCPRMQLVWYGNGRRS